ncbi:carboxypeptidase [Gracilibacillus halophilus YIM-C55.5]|uniref:Carboxypeptidase n=1 Tax=Gracilibacillus halophilus YIM-C55.5 TaxID=1308866 RepID=N4W7T2_9BACI|nr:D-alanyl-D-alanine carboxypeptidase family protein [Gracilibacillus halophilus]ENH96328.1 carboxypeptidase [Gracilibacillus halophilus YIM-C55.5]
MQLQQWIKGASIVLCLLLIACSGNDSSENDQTNQQPDDSSQEEEADQLGSPSVTELEQKFIDRIKNLEVEGTEVKNYKTKAELIEFFSEIMTTSLAEDMADTFFEVKNDTLHIKQTDEPISLLMNQDYQTKEVNQNQYKVVQEAETDMQGAYRLTVQYTYKNGQWLIAEREVERLDESNQDPEESTDDQKDSDSNQEDDEKLPEKTIYQGEQGDNVSQIQHVLSELGYELDETGTYNEKTVNAIKDFQAQIDSLVIDGIYGPNTINYLRQAIAGDITIEPGSGDIPAKNDQNREGNASIVDHPASITVLVNKNHRLPADYVPNNLVVPDVRFPFNADLPKKQMREVAARALENMFAAGDQAGVDLFAQSGYRSYNRQDAIFTANVNQYGREQANQFSAQPGESEHQTGLTMDVTSADIDFQLIKEFANTDEGQWVKQHASEYGFIIRYPKGKTNITGYQYEPWHLRYVGKDIAKEIDKNNMTFEEYLGVN